MTRLKICQKLYTTRFLDQKMLCFREKFTHQLVRNLHAAVATNFKSWNHHRKHVAGRISHKMHLFLVTAASVDILLIWGSKGLPKQTKKNKENGVHCESTQVSRKFPGRSAAWENARSLATDGKAEQCRLPMFLSGLVKTKHLEDLQKQSGRFAQTLKDDFTVFTIRTSEVCIQSHLRFFFYRNIGAQLKSRYSRNLAWVCHVLHTNKNRCPKE